MIEESQYRLPKHEQPKRKPTKAERQRAAKTLAYLKNLTWRPHGVEW